MGKRIVRDLRARILEHLDLVMVWAWGPNEDGKRGGMERRVLRVEQRRTNADLPLLRVMRALELDDQDGWLLRFLVGRALGASIFEESPRTFTVWEAFEHLLSWFESPLEFRARAIDPANPLRASGLLVDAPDEPARSAPFTLGCGFEELFLGQDPTAVGECAEVSVPRWLADAEPVGRVGAELDAWLEHVAPPSVVLRCRDPLLAAAVATATARIRGGDGTAVQSAAATGPSTPLSRRPEARCWRVWPAVVPCLDPLPALAWHAVLAGQTAVIEVVSDGPAWERDERITNLDLRRRWWHAPLVLVQNPDCGDPLGLADHEHLLDLDPLLGDGEAIWKAATAALPVGALDGAPTSRPDLGRMPATAAARWTRWWPLQAAVHGTAGARRMLGSASEPDRRPPWLRGSGAEQPGGGSAAAVPEVTLDDLVVGDELRAALQGALDAARAGRRTVVLLHGPPGSGKTHAAACLAGSLERPLLRASGAEVRGCFYGEMERALRDLFDRAANEGCVLLLDEADEWVGRRAAGSSAAVGGVRIAECGEVLQRLERFTGVAVLATNRLTALDPAVFRRCDLVLYLEPPGEIERLALWAQAAGGAVLLTATDLTLLAALPLTGGEIAAAVADARSRGAELTAVGLMAAARRRADLGMLQGS